MKRYDTANQIRADIDRFKSKVQKLVEAASALDYRADELVRSGDMALLPDIQMARKVADKKRKSALRIEKRQLTRLKHKLSEWMTPPLPGVGITDRSISTRD